MSAFDLKDKGSENASGSLCVNLTGATSTGWKQIEPNGNKWKQMEQRQRQRIALCNSVNWMERKLFVHELDNYSFTNSSGNTLNVYVYVCNLTVN